MIGVNERTEAGCHERTVLQPLAALLAHAPHLAEELWEACGGKGSVVDAAWPKWDAEKLVESEVTYPVQFNGKVRFQFAVTADGLRTWRPRCSPMSAPRSSWMAARRRR